jgi:hypothetical protein
MLNSHRKLVNAEQWIKKLFTSCVLHQKRIEKSEQGALRYRLELLCDLDDYFEFHHSLCGNASVSTPDVMLYFYARHYWNFDENNLVKSLRRLIAQNGLQPLSNLERYLNFLQNQFGTTFMGVDK